MIDNIYIFAEKLIRKSKSEIKGALNCEITLHFNQLLNALKFRKTLLCKFSAGCFLFYLQYAGWASDFAGEHFNKCFRVRNWRGGLVKAHIGRLLCIDIGIRIDSTIKY